MRCSKGGYHLFYGHCRECMISAGLKAESAYTSIPAARCQHCGQMTFGKNNRCHNCNGILKCDLCKNDMEKCVLPVVKPFPLTYCKNPHGNLPAEQIVQHSSSFPELEGFIRSVHSPPATPNYLSTGITSNVCKVIAYNAEYKNVKIGQVCKKCLNQIQEISFTDCDLEGTLPTMQNLKKLYFCRCNLSRILAFISNITLNVLIIWELVIRDMDEIIGYIKQMENRKITIIIHVHGPVVSTEKWGSLLSEAIARNDVSLVRWQHVSRRSLFRTIVTFYLPGKRRNYYCANCWKGFDNLRTVCDAELDVGGIKKKCPSREFYICKNGYLEISVPDPSTTMIYYQRLAPEANEEIHNITSRQDILEPWGFLMDVNQDYITSLLINKSQPPSTAVQQFVSPLCKMCFLN